MLGDVLERLAHDVVEEHRARRATRRRYPDRGSPTAARRAHACRPAGSRRGRTGSAGVALLGRTEAPPLLRREGRPPGRPPPAAGRPRSARRPASSITYWSRTSSLGCSATIAAAGSAARARPSRDARSAAPSARSSRNWRNGFGPGRPPSGATPGRRATGRRGPARGAGRPPAPGARTSAPTVPALGRALPRGVGVVGEHDLAGEVLQHLDVIVGERGAAGRDRVRRARRARTPSRRCSPRRSRPRRCATISPFAQLRP